MKKIILLIVILAMLWYILAPIYYYSIMCHTGMDLGLFTQRIFTFTRGNPLMVDTLAFPYSQWGDHFSPILIVLSPIGLLPRALMPIALVLIQGLSIIFAGNYIYQIAKREGVSNGSSRIIQMAFLMHPYLLHLSLFDFHPVTLSPLFVTYSVYHYDNSKKLILGIIGISLLKESMFPVAVMVIIFIQLHYNKKHLKLLAIPLICGLIYILMLYMIPQDEGFYRYSDRMGLSFAFPLQQLVMHAWLFIPLGGFVTFSWALLIGSAEYILAIGATNILSIQILHQYQTSIMVAITLSLILKWRDWMRFPVVIGSIIGLLIFSPVSIGFMNNQCLLNRDTNLEAIAFISAIPSDKVVCADNWALPSASARYELHFINESNRCDYTIMDHESPWVKIIMNDGKHDKILDEMLSRKVPIKNMSGIYVFEGQ